MTQWVQMIHITPYEDPPTLGPCSRAKVAIQTPMTGRAGVRLREAAEVIEDVLSEAMLG